MLDVGVGVQRRQHDAQPLGAARHRRIIDQLHVDARYAVACLRAAGSLRSSRPNHAALHHRDLLDMVHTAPCDTALPKPPKLQSTVLGIVWG